MVANGEYLYNDYTFDISTLIEPIRKASTVRQISNVTTSLAPEDIQVDIKTLTDDLHINIGPDPYETETSRQFLSRQYYQVPALSGKIMYEYDELQRINRSSATINNRTMALAWKLADIEDALALAASSTGVPDCDATPFVENGTGSAFDLSSYTTGKTSIASYIGTVAGTFGNLKRYPLIFAYNDKFLQTALGLSNDTTDAGLIEYIDAQLMKFGGAGSMSIQSPHLGCAVTYSSNDFTITDEADEACALFVKSPDHYNIWASPLDQRGKPTTKAEGYYNKIVERWFPYVMRSTSILYDLDATP